jgi:hypothetical protein
MQLFTPKETARFLRISTSELEALVEAKQIAYVEVRGEPRFRCDHIVKFIRENPGSAGRGKTLRMGYVGEEITIFLF